MLFPLIIAFNFQASVVSKRQFSIPPLRLRNVLLKRIKN